MESVGTRLKLPPDCGGYNKDRQNEDEVKRINIITVRIKIDY